MILYNDKLKVLYEMVCRKQHLEKVHAELTEQRSSLLDQVSKLKEASIKEQADVDKLEGGSLAAFFYNVIGKMDEKLTKEREEAYAAAVKYDTANKELQAVEADLEKNEKELDGLKGCEKQYEELLLSKKEVMKNSGHWAMEKVFEFEQRITYLNNQDKELEEAIAEGRRAADMAEGVLSSLKSAESWGTFDVLGGGIIADALKYDELNNAQMQIENLQEQLRRFRTELVDVTLDSEMNVNIDSFLQFADWFWDNIFTDWAVLDKIHNSQNQVENTRCQIELVMQKLQGMKDEACAEREKVEAKLEELIVQVQM